MKTTNRKPRTWDLSNLPTVVMNSSCWADVCRNLKKSPGGSTQATIIRWSKRMKLDTSHFTDKNRNAGLRDYSKNKRIPSEQLFVENSVYPRKAIRTRILSDNLIPYQCDMCQSDGSWMGTTIALQIDHINGVSNDHRLENLRWVCPNCHATTPTWGGKNVVKITAS